MRSMVKMDLYRMFHTRSLYVVWIFMGIVVLFSVFMLKSDYDSIEVDLNEGTVSRETDTDVTASDEADDTDVNVNVGLIVDLPDEDGEKVTLLDLIYANTAGMVIAMFIAIFAVMFSIADINNGYVKNIAGQVSDRGRLVITKACALFIYTTLSFVLYVIVTMIGSLAFFRYLKIGNVNELLIYLGIELLLHFAFAVICMTLTYVTRSSVISMIIAICMCANLMSLVYGLLDIIINKLTNADFQIIKYTVLGNISLLQMNPAGNECGVALTVAGAFAAAMTFVSYHIFKKRDI